MSLATRCTSCGTIFKVVQDQLKVSEGWVRCGRCNEVFNALDGLFDLERDPPPQRPTTAPPRESTGNAPPGEPPRRPAAPPPATPQADRATAPTQPMGLDAPRAESRPNPRAAAPQPAMAPPPPPPEQSDDLPATHEDDALDSRWLLRPSSDGRSASERRPRQVSTSDDFADARFPKDVELDFDDSDFPLDPDAPAAAARPMPEIKRGKDGKARSRSGDKRKKEASSARGKTGKPSAPAATPSFVRRADRQAQWRHPAVRATLAGVALALSGLLAAQVGIAFRDELSARHPELRPLVEQICAVTGCEIAPWRHIDDLAVDSVTLVRGSQAGSSSSSTSSDSEPGDGAANAYKLSVVLHNRASVPIATPHVELSLTDASGELVSKRALSPAEFGFTSAELPPDSNTTLQTRLASDGGRIAGYTVELFYP
jgi:predicted Zn finger-like uncharacterized protein